MSQNLYKFIINAREKVCNFLFQYKTEYQFHNIIIRELDTNSTHKSHAIDFLTRRL
jgi:hypothetical protein